MGRGCYSPQPVNMCTGDEIGAFKVYACLVKLYPHLAVVAQEAALIVLRLVKEAAGSLGIFLSPLDLDWYNLKASDRISLHIGFGEILFFLIYNHTYTILHKVFSWRRAVS